MGCEGVDAVHGPSEGQVVGPAGAPVCEGRQITVLGTGEDGDIHLPGSGGCQAGNEWRSDGRLSLARSIAGSRRGLPASVVAGGAAVQSQALGCPYLALPTGREPGGGGWAG